MPIVPLNLCPTLQSVCDLYRSLINDDGPGVDGASGGIVGANLYNPSTLRFLNAGIGDLYADLRNVGDPELIVDNALVLGLPGLAAPNQAVQVSLGYLGYFDGFQNHANWTLPSGMVGVDRVWERARGEETFYPLKEHANGLPSHHQGQTNRMYEWRGNALWMPGALGSVDLRLRGKIALPKFEGSSLNFASTYVPLPKCETALVDKMLVRYARRMSPEQVADARVAAEESLNRLKLEIVRQAQRKENRRRDFGEEAVGGVGGWMGDL